MTNEFEPEVSRSITKLDAPKQNIVYSIVISKSTKSVLRVDVPNVEDVGMCSSYVCMIQPPTVIEKCSCSKYVFLTRANKFDEEKHVKNKECDKIESQMTYLPSICNTFVDSFSSLETEEEYLDAFEYTDDEHKVSFQPILKPTKVYTRPLLTTTSSVQSNNIKSDPNNIYVTLKTKASVTKSGWVNMCRICHGGKSIGNLLAPCHCRGSIGFTHMACLERWLKESSSSRCELCNYHFTLVRQPKYSIPASILMFLRHPGEHITELVLDLLAFAIYTPSAIVTSYMMIVLLEQIAHNRILSNTRTSAAHVVAFTAVFGLATIDFTYSSWLIVCIQKHFKAWKEWYRHNSEVKVILPNQIKDDLNQSEVDAELD